MNEMVKIITVHSTSTEGIYWPNIHVGESNMFKSLKSTKFHWPVISQKTQINHLWVKMANVLAMPKIQGALPT
jgi:hypothetical protein